MPLPTVPSCGHTSKAASTADPEGTLRSGYWALTERRGAGLLKLLFGCISGLLVALIHPRPP